MEKLTAWGAKRSGASMTINALKDGKPLIVTGVDWIGLRDGKIVTDAEGEPDFELDIGLKEVGLRTNGGVVINADLPEGTKLYAVVP